MQQWINVSNGSPVSGTHQDGDDDYMNMIMILGLIMILKLISNGSLAPGTGQMMRIEMYGDPVVWLLTILIGLTNVRC